MACLRIQRWRAVAASFAGLALYIQLAFASWGMLVLAVPPASEDFGGHVLCLAEGDLTSRAPPPDKGSSRAPAHHHFAFCCLCHLLPGIPAAVAQTPQLFAYVGVARDARSDADFLAGRRHRPATARGPPVLT